MQRLEGSVCVAFKTPSNIIYIREIQKYLHKIVSNFQTGYPALCLQASIYAGHSARNVRLLSSTGKFHSSFSVRPLFQKAGIVYTLFHSSEDWRARKRGRGMSVKLFKKFFWRHTQDSKRRGVRKGELTWEHCTTYTPAAALRRNHPQKRKEEQFSHTTSNIAPR